MELKSLISHLIYLTFFIFIYGAVVKCEDGMDGLNPHHRKILKDYEAIAKLTYGDKCNAGLESQNNKINGKLKPYLKKLLTNAFKHGLSGRNPDDFELTESMEDARDDIFYEIDQFTKVVKESPYGLNGICDDSMALHCDKSVGECRCGKSKQTKGYSFILEGWNCNFDFGSGCVQSDFADISTSVCREGSICVTAIEEMHCTFANSLDEAMRNPSRFKNLKHTKGYACFCDPIGDQDPNQNKYVYDDNDVLKSSDHKNSNSSPHQKRLSSESAASSYFNTSGLKGIFVIFVLIFLQM